MLIEKFIPENGDSAAGRALRDMLRDENPGMSYADMMRLRISGAVSDECKDTYYVAHEDGVCLSRLWHGWGRHDFAIGNFGNFVTVEAARGKGIGREILKVWFDDLEKEEKKPLGLFCTTNGPILKTYLEYGFTLAISGTESGPLYLPLGDSPKTFLEFCELYYEPTNKLISRKASVEWRHEIDCLLKFSFIEMGLQFGIGEFSYVEEALLRSPENTRMIFTESGRCVGWSVGESVQIHPKYEGLKIES